VSRPLASRHAADLLVLTAWAGLCALLAVRLAGYAPDDMFISYRYAWNLAHGEGFVFNPGERVFGLTNPGHALMLALLYGVTGVPVHLLGGMVFAAALWAVAVLLWLDLKRRGAAWEAALGGTLVLGSSYVWAAAGSASAAVLAFLAGAAVLVERRPATAGLLAGLAVWYRPDAVLGVAALGLLAWLERRRLPWRFALAAGGLVLLGAGAAWLWFGSAWPGTLEAKRIMVASREVSWTGAERFWAGAAPLLARHLGPAWLLLVALGIAGQWPLFARGGRAARTLVLYGTGIAVAYPLLGVPYYLWYTVPPVVALLYGVGGAVAGIVRAGAAALAGEAGSQGYALRHRLAAAGGGLAAALLLAVPVLSFAERSSSRFQAFVDGNHYDTFRRAGQWIRDNSLPEERIAYGEIGNLAYFSERPVDDLMGLVTPQALPYVAAADPNGAFLLRPPDFFLDHPANPHPGIAHTPWFARAYYPVASFPDPRGPGEATVYRKYPDAELPPPRPPREPPPRRRDPDRATRSR
jgi:hypothetical protein